MMKKILFLASTFGLATIAGAQNFFDAVNYRGAFEPAPASRWTDGWTNFDPQNAVYPATTVNVPAGDITSNTTWTSNNVYLIDGFVYVTNGATLTIQPGTVIRGTGSGTLIICRGAKVDAQGTAQNPIIFTSNSQAGQRDYGDWGGVVILGSARHNIATGPDAPAEGGIAKPLPSGDGRHGGNNDDDNSGILSYVRIEFCGIPLTQQANSEINGLTMYSVGRNTQIDHIQVSYCGDDSFEWFGGTVNCKYLVAHRGWDDDFDTDNGFRGKIQFALAVRDSRIADQSGSNGFESDNDAQGSGNYPKTSAVFSNVTIIGPNYQGNPDTTNNLYRRALHIRRNSAISVFNSIFTGYPDAGLMIDAKPTIANLCGDTLEFKKNILAGMTVDWKVTGDTLCINNASDLGTWATNTTNDNEVLAQSNDVDLVDPFNLTNPDARPNGSSSAASGAEFGYDKLQPANYVGINEAEDFGGAFSVFPNPTSEVLNIAVESLKHTDAEIIITDLTGKVISVTNRKLAEGDNTISLDVQQLVNGVYFVNVRTANGSMIGRFIKK